MKILTPAQIASYKLNMMYSKLRIRSEKIEPSLRSQSSAGPTDVKVFLQFRHVTVIIL